MRNASSKVCRLVVLTAIAVCLFPATGLGQDESDLSPEVIAAAERGRQLFDEGRYREAIDFLDEAYETHDEAIFFQYTGRCYQELGEYCRAAQNYRRFLRESSPPEMVRSRVQERLIDLDDLCERDPVEVDEPDDRVIHVDQGDDGPPRRFGGGGGEGDDDGDSGRGLRIAGLVLMGVGGAAALTGVGLWSAAYARCGHYVDSTNPDDGGCEEPAERWDSLALYGDVIGISGFATLALGLILYIVGRSRDRSSTSRTGTLMAPVDIQSLALRPLITPF